MMIRRAVLLVVLALLPATACNCGDETLKKVSATEVQITSPDPTTVVVSSEQVVFTASARNPAGLKWLMLKVGDVEAKTCEASEEANDTVDCEFAFMPPEFAAQIVDAKLKLTAVAKDLDDSLIDKSIEVAVKPLRIAFKKPFLDRAVNPDFAVVRGTSDLELEVVSTLPVTEVVVVYDDGKRLRVFDSAPYKASVNWPVTMEVGEHKLTARATDTDGQQDTAILQIKVVCAGDMDCIKLPGTRCCTDDGQCHPTVGRGAECDCQHPCPIDQGCFPGTCGQTPRRCRPGCFPGDQNRKADRCTAQDGRPAYCSELPYNEQTAENRGGGCAPADACSITQQDCPMLPVDRSQPVGPDNPAVRQKCVPSSPTSTVCQPAGPLGDGATGCGESCSEAGTRTGCAPGFLCVTTIDANRQPIGPPHCAKLCPEPSSMLPSRSTCSSGQYCMTLLGAGYEEYTIGACGKPSL